MDSRSVAPGGCAGPRLDLATLTVTTVYPSCSEASFVRGRPAPRRPPSAGVTAPDAGRAADEAARRARTHIRRWCKHHGATRLGTLTYAGAGQHDLDAFWADVEGFRRRLREATKRRPVEVLVVHEWHPGGHGLHAHIALSGYVPKATLAEAWGHGFVDVRRLKSRRHRGRNADAGIVAMYLSGYVSKNPTGPPRPKNRKRYSVPKGTSPEPVRFWSFTLDDAWASAEELVGRALEVVWRSSSDEGWLGPPTMLAMGSP